MPLCEAPDEAPYFSMILIYKGGRSMDQLNHAAPRPVILCLSQAGMTLARKLADALDGDIHGHAVRCPDAPHHFGRARQHIADLFCSGRPVIGICAAAF